MSSSSPPKKFDSCRKLEAAAADAARSEAPRRRCCSRNEGVFLLRRDVEREVLDVLLKVLDTARMSEGRRTTVDVFVVVVDDDDEDDGPRRVCERVTRPWWCKASSTVMLPRRPLLSRVERLELLFVLAPPNESGSKDSSTEFERSARVDLSRAMACSSSFSASETSFRPAAVPRRFFGVSRAERFGPELEELSPGGVRTALASAKGSVRGKIGGENTATRLAAVLVEGVLNTERPFPNRGESHASVISSLAKSFDFPSISSFDFDRFDDVDELRSRASTSTSTSTSTSVASSSISADDEVSVLRRLCLRTISDDWSLDDDYTKKKRGKTRYGISSTSKSYYENADFQDLRLS